MGTRRQYLSRHSYYVFEGAKVTRLIHGNGRMWSDFKVDPTAKPKTIELRNMMMMDCFTKKGPYSQRGTYTLEGDELRLTLNGVVYDPPGTGKPRSRNVVYVLKRRPRSHGQELTLNTIIASGGKSSVNACECP